MGGEAAWMDAREGAGEERAAEPERAHLAARRVPRLSETSLLAVNLLLDTVSLGLLSSSGRQQDWCLRVEEQGRFQRQGRALWFGFLFLPPGVRAIISLEK